MSKLPPSPSKNNNNHSLFKKSCPISMHNSSEISFENPFNRKMSVASLRDYVDIDKLIGDIKIRPVKSNEYS
jgi:hypothetical protein